MNHVDVIFYGATFAATCIGYVLGRLARRQNETHETEDEPEATRAEAVHPYRDAAGIPGAEAAPPKKKRLFPYKTHDTKYVYLCCPACQGKITEMPVCTCDEVAGGDVHFHVKCTNCHLRFAMETAVAAAERKRAQKDAKAN